MCIEHILILKEYFNICLGQCENLMNADELNLSARNHTMYVQIINENVKEKEDSKIKNNGKYCHYSYSFFLDFMYTYLLLNRVTLIIYICFWTYFL